MQMENKDLELLINKYREGTVSDQEKALLESWYLQRDVNAIAELSSQEFAEDLLLIGEGLPLQGTVRKLVWWPKIAAVAACLALFFVTYLEWPAIKDRLHPVQLTALT